MEYRIENMGPKKIAGKQLVMSLACNKTPELWRSFMMRRNEVTNSIGNELYSIQVYDKAYFTNFNPGKEFEKWAGVEVTDFDHVPEGMLPFHLPGGLYAVFLYHGAVSEAASVFDYIFRTWLPTSGYVIDHRPHFEILGEKFNKDSPDSEEEICIPVKKLVK